MIPLLSDYIRISEYETIVIDMTFTSGIFLLPRRCTMTPKVLPVYPINPA